MFVSDTTALISFARVNQLVLIKDVLDEIWIPEAVYQEMKQPGMPGSEAVDEETWIRREALSDASFKNSLANTLGSGEREAIALAREKSAILITDDKAARAAASSHGVDVIGTLNILQRAKRSELIPAMKPLLDQMIQAGYRVSLPLYTESLLHVGEITD